MFWRFTLVQITFIFNIYLIKVPVLPPGIILCDCRMAVSRPGINETNPLSPILLMCKFSSTEFNVRYILFSLQTILLYRFDFTHLFLVRNLEMVNVFICWIHSLKTFSKCSVPSHVPIFQILS